MPRQIIICGGRDYHFQARDIALLDRLHAEHSFSEVVHGGCTGADLCGKAWAVGKGIPDTPFLAEWTKLGKAAGPARNVAIAKYVGDDAIVVAFPGGRGTANMLKCAMARGLAVLRAESDAG